MTAVETRRIYSLPTEVAELAEYYQSPLVVVKDEKGHLGAVLVDDPAHIADCLSALNAVPLGILPAIYPEWLGDQQFNSIHGCRFPYIVGEMANGIATAEMVIASTKAGLMGSFGAAGLVPEVVEKNLQYIRSQLGDQYINWASNLIHSPNEPAIEAAVVDLYLKYGVRRISASAYMSLSPHIVYYACKGLRTNEHGKIIRENYVIAKISRPEVAERFLRPAPEKILQSLLEQGKITQQEADLARHIPVAEDITVEADSGGHTDNRPLPALFPTILELAKKINQAYDNRFSYRIGAAGGIGTPAAMVAAFSMGAAYVLTGSINQCSLESGLSQLGKEMLTKADIADVMMAPAADMFELGVKLQILKKGTLFGPRAAKLYDLYITYKALSKIPPDKREQIEHDLFRDDLEKVWEGTQNYFTNRDPKQIEKARQNEQYRMALVFRWYLGLSSRWAIAGDPSRLMDYQIWCGPAMGSFNEWVKGSFLEPLENRTVVEMAKNLLVGAAYLTRLYQLKSAGFRFPEKCFHFKPRKMS